MLDPPQILKEDEFPDLPVQLAWGPPFWAWCSTEYINKYTEERN
jgi:hypothetical protein